MDSPATYIITCMDFSCYKMGYYKYPLIFIQFRKSGNTQNRRGKKKKKEERKPCQIRDPKRVCILQLCIAPCRCLFIYSFSLFYKLMIILKAVFLLFYCASNASRKHKSQTPWKSTTQSQSLLTFNIRYTLFFKTRSLGAQGNPQ